VLLVHEPSLAVLRAIRGVIERQGEVSYPAEALAVMVGVT
jgi:hypothetical protein